MTYSLPTYALLLMFATLSCVSPFSSENAKMETQLAGTWLMLGASQSSKGEITYQDDGKCLLTIRSGITDFRCECEWDLSGGILQIETKAKTARCPIQPAKTVYQIKSLTGDDLYLIVQATGETVHERRQPK